MDARSCTWSQPSAHSQRRRAPPAASALPPHCLCPHHRQRQQHVRRRSADTLAQATPSDADASAVPGPATSPPPPTVLRSPFAGSSSGLQPLSAASSPPASWSALNAGVFGDVISGGSTAVSEGRRLPGSRKAELYLVRTDGFTCTRETVKGAFPPRGYVLSTIQTAAIRSSLTRNLCVEQTRRCGSITPALSSSCSSGRRARSPCLCSRSWGTHCYRSS